MLKKHLPEYKAHQELWSAAWNLIAAAADAGFLFGALVGLDLASAALGQRAGLGLDKIRAFSRHRTIATLMIYVDEHDRTQTQKTLGDLVASTLTP